VDASGTTVSIIMPTEPKVTKYEVGVPTSINLENPTVLTPAGVLVDSYVNLDSLVIKNIPSTKSYAMFDKITNMYVIGGSINYGYRININDNPVGENAYTYEGDNNVFVISPVSVSGVTSIEVTTPKGYRLMEMDSNNICIDYWAMNGTRTISLSNTTQYVTLGNMYGNSQIGNITITDTTTNTVLFKYIIN